MTPDYQRYAADAKVLAGIGRALSTQPVGLRVRLPRVLADLAAAAWARNDDRGLPREETPEQATARHRAGVLALIGLSIESSAGGPDADDVVVDLDARYVGAALEAAEDAGLLADAVPGPGDSATAKASGQPVHLYAVIRIDFCVPAGEPQADQAASSGPFQFQVTVKEVLPTAGLASDEARQLNELNKNKHCAYFWQVTRYYAAGRMTRPAS